MDKIVHFIKDKMNKTMNKLYLKIFNKNQRNEIKFGLLENIDVKCYAKHYFNEKQMREIRYGLEEGLNVESYAKKQYNSNQMRQIRLSLENYKQ